MSGIVACTIADANYLPFVRVLARSFRERNPNTPFRVLLIASETQCAAADREGLAIIRPHELAVQELPAMLQRYGRKQICSALKPALLRHLLERGYESVIFLDSDILVTHSLEPVFATVAGHALTLTPHVSNSSGTFARFGLAQYLLLAGMYNAGFVGVHACDESRQFLTWWEARLRTHCLDATKNGIHYDQRWLDHAIGFVGDLHILRDPGCNVAYWNLGDLKWSIHNSDYQVNGSPLRFFHFSGYDPTTPSRVTRYIPKLTMEQLGPLANIFHKYAVLLREAGYTEIKCATG